jgi:hypothetical protein
LDDLVGGGQQRFRDGEAEGFLLRFSAAKPLASLSIFQIGRCNLRPVFVQLRDSFLFLL